MQFKNCVTSIDCENYSKHVKLYEVDVNSCVFLQGHSKNDLHKQQPTARASLENFITKMVSAIKWNPLVAVIKNNT